MSKSQKQTSHNRVIMPAIITVAILILGGAVFLTTRYRTPWSDTQDRRHLLSEVITWQADIPAIPRDGDQLRRENQKIKTVAERLRQFENTPGAAGQAIHDTRFHAEQYGYYMWGVVKGETLAQDRAEKWAEQYRAQLRALEVQLQASI